MKGNKAGHNLSLQSHCPCKNEISFQMSTATQDSNSASHPKSGNPIGPDGTEWPFGWEDRFHGLMLLAGLMAVAISFVCGYFGQLTIDFADVVPKLALVLVLMAAAAQYRYRSEVKCYHSCLMVLWVIVITNLHLFPMYFAARRDVPMCDDLFAACDRMMGFEVPDVLATLAPYTGFNKFMLAAYNTLIAFMTIAVVIPMVFDRIDRAKAFAIGCLVAASVSMPIFACYQAVGPYFHYDYVPMVDSLDEIEGMLAVLKADGWYQIDINNKDGLICFPSFHVILTVLAAAAVWPFKKFRILAVTWASLIVASTVTCGIHYTVDVVGGLVVAGLSHCVALKYLQWESAESTNLDRLRGWFSRREYEYSAG